MFRKQRKRNIVTLPNLLSLLRLMLIPVYARMYLQASTAAQYRAAGLLITFSCLTDLLDGWIARKYNMISFAGKILDPLADKLTQFSLMLCLFLRHPRVGYVLVLFIVKEIFQLTTGIIMLCQGKMLSGALMAGKVCTAVLFISLIFLVFFPDIKQPLIDSVILLDITFLSISFIAYVLAYWGRHPKVKKMESE